MFNTITELAIILASILTILLFKLFITTPKRPIFNIYQIPSSFYWAKVYLMHAILKLNRFYTTQDDVTLDKVRKSSMQNLQIADIGNLYGSSLQGDYISVTLAGDNFFYIKIATRPGILQASINDDFKIISQSTGKIKLTYKGMMSDSGNNNKNCNVVIDLDWAPDTPKFSFDREADTFLLAKEMALEVWSRDYFDLLKKYYQKCSEQIGELKGTATVNEEKFHLTMNSCQTYRFGQSIAWDTLHRYTIHAIAVENGDYFIIGKFCIPIVFSSLTTGFMYLAKSKKCYPIQNYDFQLYQHGEDGVLPIDYGFSFTAANQDFMVKIIITDSAFHYTDHQKCKIIKAFCNVDINGSKGKGISDWLYRNIEGFDVQ